MIKRENMINIDMLEKQAAAQRDLIARGKDPRTFIPKSEAPKPVFVKKNDGQEIRCVAIPEEIIRFDGGTAVTQKVRFEMQGGRCDPQSRIAIFDKAVKVTEDGIFIEIEIKEKQRFPKAERRKFDPWSVFSGNPNDRRTLKGLGVHFAQGRRL